MDKYSLYLGDCLEVMDKLIEQGVVVDMVLCDPPYGTTKCKWDNSIPFAPMWERINKLTKPNGAIVLFGTEPFTSFLICSNPKIFKEKLTWKKQRPSNFGCAKTKHMKYTEDIAVFYKKQCTFNRQMVPRIDRRVESGHKNNGFLYTRTKRNDGTEIAFSTDYEPRSFKEYDPNWKNPTNIIEVPCIPGNAKEKVDHPTQKPVALLEYLIKTYTNEEELVLDFTMGSGSTGVACLNTGRRFIGIELDEKYYNIAINRMKGEM